MDRLALAVETALRRVKVPGYDIDVINSGLITRFRFSKDASRIATFVDVTGKTPTCSFCKFISSVLLHTTLKRVKEEVKKLGFNVATFIDAFTGKEIDLE
ncbi:MAG: hypothetical protein QXK12_01910 [Candidatus Nezhaarchaeales archaeon]